MNLPAMLGQQRQMLLYDLQVIMVQPQLPTQAQAQAQPRVPPLKFDL